MKFFTISTEVIVELYWKRANVYRADKFLFLIKRNQKESFIAWRLLRRFSVQIRLGNIWRGVWELTSEMSSGSYKVYWFRWLDSSIQTERIFLHRTWIYTKLVDNSSSKSIWWIRRHLTAFVLFRHKMPWLWKSLWWSISLWESDTCEGKKNCPEYFSMST